VPEGPQPDYLRVLRKRAAGAHQLMLAHLQLTYRCNFRCVHCYCIHDAPGRELNTTQWHAVIDQLADLGCLELVLTGGEPFLRPDLESILRHARARRFNVMLFTNGYFIDEAWADRLAALNIWSVELSLYGASERVNQAVTQRPNSLARVQRAVDLLLDRGIRLTLKAPLMRQLVHEVDALLEFARRRKIRISFTPEMTPKDDGDLSPLAHQLSPADLEAFLLRHTRTQIQPDEPDARACMSGNTFAVISPFGEVLPCLQVRRSLGQVTEQPLAEIWNGANELLERLRGLRRADFELPAGTSRLTQLCAGLNLTESGRIEHLSASSNSFRIGQVMQAAHDRKRGCG